MNIINILALILFGIGIVLILDTDKFHNKKIKLRVKQNGEGMTNAERDRKEQELAEQQEAHYKARNMQSIDSGVTKESDFIKMKYNSKTGKQKLLPVMSVSDMDTSRIAKEVEKCKIIDETGDCSNLIGSHCGYCMSSNKILFGDKNGPKVDVCKKNTPGKLDWWIPPGGDAGKLCTEMKERAICRTMRDCGDRGGNKRICAWCPVKGVGFAYKVNAQTGGLEPKYPKKDKCDWPFKGIDTVWSQPKWHGWSGASKDTRVFKTMLVPIMTKRNLKTTYEAMGPYVGAGYNRKGQTAIAQELKDGFLRLKNKSPKYAVWHKNKSLYYYFKQGDSIQAGNLEESGMDSTTAYRLDSYQSQKVLVSGSISMDKSKMGPGGDCDADKDCPDGWKCGQRGSDGLKGIKGLYGRQHGKDYCYDPNFAGILGPLVPQAECKTFNQRFPCMTPNLLTGPHTTACFQDLWGKSGCSGDVTERTTGTEQGRKALKTWNSISYVNVLGNMKGFFKKMKSNDYQTAKQANLVCKGRDVNPCEGRFYSKFKKKSRPTECIDKLYKESGCSSGGKLNRKNLRKWKSSTGGGIPGGWEEGQNYNWTPQNYLAKLSQFRQKASLYKRKMGTTGDIQKLNANADKAIYYNEMCHGITPKVPTITSKIKPCWKDFVEVMRRSHGVKLSQNENSIVFKKDPVNVSNSHMKDSYMYRRTMGNENRLGQNWGGQKTVTKVMYERPHFPYWKFMGNSKEIYTKNKVKWNDFTRRIGKLPGIKVPNSDAVYMENWTAWTRLMKIYKINPKNNAHEPVNGKCSTCDLVPCGQCQQGCSSSSCPTGTKNSCANNNQGKKPRFCLVPPANVLTRAHWNKPGFPYWAFMRVLQRLERG